MPGPTRTANLLVLYGHGAVLDQTFDFRRPDASKVNLYSWTREGIPVWDIQIQAAATQALANNTISGSYATVNSSRIGGAQFKDYIIAAPTGLALPTIPPGYSTTAIAALGATAHHDAATLAASTRILLMLNAAAPAIRFSALLNDPNFSARPFDILWCACKS